MRWGPRVRDTVCPVSTVDHGQRGQLGPGGPRAVTQRRGPGVPRRSRRGFAAGDKTVAGLAGLRRESRTGGHLARDLARSNEETKPRRMVWSVGRGGDRNCVGDEWRRRWGSGPRRDRRCSACFGERRSWARSTALQELVGATSSSGGARWRALRRQWRTAELGLRAS